MGGKRNSRTGLGLALIALGLALGPIAHAKDRPVIRSEADLPGARFTLAAAPSKAFTEDAFLQATLPALKQEAERVLQGFDIKDTVVADRLRSGLVSIALLQNRPEDAAALVRQWRLVATKPQLQAIGLMLDDALAASLAKSGPLDCQQGAARIGALLKASDPTLVRDEALSKLVQAESASALFYGGVVQAEMDPSFSEKQSIGLMDGLRLARFRANSDLLATCRPAFTAAVRAWASDPKNSPQDIWAAREPDKAALAGASPVTVAVWDGGYDPALFGGQLAIDPSEPLDGQDNDGNGVIDDWNGPTYDYSLRPISTPYPPPSPELAPQLAFQMALSKGLLDMQYGAATAEADLFGRRSREAGPADQLNDTLLYEEVGIRSHGTQVASEIADGAPFVRLYNLSAIYCCNGPISSQELEAGMGRWAKAVAAVGPRLRRANVRVINLSWSLTKADILAGLTQAGSGMTESAAAKRADALFKEADNGLRDLVKACPDILFVVGAGNSNQDDEIFAATPQSIVAPNVLIVGAAGTNGRPTSFTTFGDGVGIYAWGEAVPVRTPGGTKMRNSGTSMAAPLVSRAAASMLAANPNLNPAQLVEGLKATATLGEGGIRLLHPADAISWAKARK